MKIKAFVILLSAISILVPAVVDANEVSLGKARVYKSYQDDQGVEITLVSLGEKDSELVLANYKVDGHQFDDKSIVYFKQCETTRCEKIFLTQVGGTTINLISDQGYFGNYYEATLPDRNKKIPLYYDKKLSATRNAGELYSNHLKSIFRITELNDAKSKVELAHSNFKTSCQSSAKLNTNADNFVKQSKTSLIGMAAHYLKQLSNYCKNDNMYKEVFSEIKKINFIPGQKYKELSLSDAMELTIHLSGDIYNPSIQAKTDIDKL